MLAVTMERTIRTYTGAVAIVTGGASGIGRAIGVELANRGAEVVLADVQDKAAEEAALSIRREAGRATAVKLDVRDGDAVRRVVDDTFERTGRVDYVFNNAGTGVMGEAHLLEARDWDLTIDINLKGVVRVIEAAYPRLVAQGFGHLVNTASVAGLITSPFLSAYSATKHAVVGLSKAMRVEAARHGVRVSALCPGAIKTPILTGGVYGGNVYGLESERALAWWAKLRPMAAAPFAKQVLDAVAKNEGVIVLPRQYKAVVRMMRLFPKLEEKLAQKMLAQTLERFPEIARGRAQRSGSENGAARAAATPAS